MRRMSTIATLVLSLFLCTIILTAVQVLYSLEAPGDISVDKLSRRPLTHLVTTSTFWSQFPGYALLLRPSCLVHFGALLLTVPVLGATYFLLRYQRQCRSVTLVTTCLMIGLIPYVSARVALSFTLPSEEIGPWLAIMFLGIFYCALAAAAFAARDLCPAPLQPTAASPPTLQPHDWRTQSL